MSEASLVAGSKAASEASQAGSWGLRFNILLLPATLAASDLISETFRRRPVRSKLVPSPSLAICRDYLLFPGYGPGEWVIKRVIQPRSSPSFSAIIGEAISDFSLLHALSGLREWSARRSSLESLPNFLRAPGERVM